MRFYVLMLFGAFYVLHSADMPDGYRESGGKFSRFDIILPNEWNYKEVVDKENVQSCFVSKENIDEKKSFSTGVSIYVFSNIKDSLKMNGSTYVLAQSAEAFAKKGLIFTGYNAQLRNHGMAVNYGYVDQTNPDDVIKCFVVLLEDVKNDQVITVVCESPKDDFEAMMKVLSPMLSRLEVR